MYLNSAFTVFSFSCSILFADFLVVYCHSVNDTKTLWKKLFSKYDKHIRPIQNQSEPVVVKFGLGLMSIKEFDEVEESIAVNSFFDLEWVDEFMTWNPAQYGGVSNIARESKWFWTPNLVLVNNARKIEKIGDSWQLLRFKHNGIASYYPGEVLEASCTVDITYYPFDRHICSLNFTIWASWWSEVLLKTKAEKVYLMHFSENGAWNLTDSAFHISYTVNGAVNLDALLLLERKPQFVVVNVLIPMICLVFLNALTFLMPTESGERISFSVSVLLSIAVFLTVTGDNLPKTSNPMPILSFYLLSVLTISAFTTVASVLSTWLFYRDGSSPVPTRWKILTRRFRPNPSKSQSGKSSIKCSRNQEKVRRYMSDENGVKQEDKGATKFSDLSDSNSCHGSFVSCFGESVEPDAFKEPDVSWREVSAVIDRVFFVLCIIILSIATVTFLCIVLSADRRTLSKHVQAVPS